MSRLSLFNSPLLLGFDHFEEAIDRLAKTPADGYPPYNIEQTAENGLRITLAVAGFRREDLAIQIDGNQLVIRGRQAEDKDRQFLHRGIATRQFKRTFVLAEGIEVSDATIDNGLLHVDLVRPDPKTQVRQIEIRGAASGNGTTAGPRIEVEPAPRENAGGRAAEPRRKV